MDVRCPRCGEPWDMDCLHDAAAATGTSFDTQRKRFYKIGCAALEAGMEGETATDPTCARTGRTEALTALSELSGDDIDGYAADVEDFEQLGLL